LQSIGGDFGAFICNILSGPLTYGGGVFILCISLIPTTYKKVTYHVLLFMSIISIDFILKIMYGRIRPFLINPDIKISECPCDYGMPSGHSGNAVVIYYIINQFAAAHFDKKVNKTEKDQFLRYLTTSLCVSLGLIIPLTRIYLGVHSWNQVIMGILITMLFILFTNEDMMFNLLKEMRKSLLYPILVLGICIIITGYLVVMFYIRKNKSSEYDTNMYWS